MAPQSEQFPRTIMLFVGLPRRQGRLRCCCHRAKPSAWSHLARSMTPGAHPKPPPRSPGQSAQQMPSGARRPGVGQGRGGRDGGHNHARNPAAPLTRIIRGYLRCCARCSGVIKPRCAARGHVFKHVRRVGVRSFQDQQTVTAAENQLHYLHQDERPGGCSGLTRHGAPCAEQDQQRAPGSSECFTRRCWSKKSNDPSRTRT